MNSDTSPYRSGIATHRSSLLERLPMREVAPHCQCTPPAAKGEEMLRARNPSEPVVTRHCHSQSRQSQYTKMRLKRQLSPPESPSGESITNKPLSTVVKQSVNSRRGSFSQFDMMGGGTYLSSLVALLLLGGLPTELVSPPAAPYTEEEPTDT